MTILVYKLYPQAGTKHIHYTPVVLNRQTAYAYGILLKIKAAFGTQVRQVLKSINARLPKMSVF